MRSFGEYSAKEWFRLWPFIERVKRKRDDFVQEKFLQVHPEGLGGFLNSNGHLRGKNIVATIAFNQPEVLDFCLRMATRHLADTTVLVLDNSNRKEARTEIERVCQTRGVAYLGLPENPSRHPNRCHGMAMTWIWRNVIAPLHPRIGGFIDHDVILTERVSISQLLAGQPFYGVPNVAKRAWSLWAGFCFYDLAEIGSAPLNFLNDFSRGVDTGGRNWECLYHKYDHKKLKFAAWRLFDVMDEPAGVPRQVEVIDGTWMHIGGTTCRDMYRKNAGFYGRMLREIDAGATWEKLRTKSGDGEAIRPTPMETIIKSRRNRWRKFSFDDPLSATV
jgi:hypothetical protein